MKVPFIGGSYQDRSLRLDAQRCVNLYVEIDETKEGKNTAALHGTPGILSFLTLPTAPNRGFWVALGRLFVVAGNMLYEVFSNGTSSSIGTLLTFSGYVGMSDNGTQLAIVDGPNLYIYILNSAGQVIKAATAVKSAAGTNYAIGDQITLAGGTPTSGPTVLQVATISGSGVATVTIVEPGSYAVVPANAVAQASTTGSGTGATFTVTWNTFSAGTFWTNPTPAFQGANTITYIDGYFVLPTPLTNLFYLSKLKDGTFISLLDQASKEGNSDNIITVINDHRQLYLMGSLTGEVWYDNGSNNFPFSPIEGIFIESGIIAAFSLVKHDNSMFWLGSDARGQGVVYRNQNFTPLRVSTHPVEKALRSYGDLSNAIGFAYQEEGHDFYCLNVPNADTTWCMDDATKIWHERRWLDPRTGMLTRQRQIFHAFVFGKHIVGDYQTGDLYIQSMDYLTDNGNTIVRQRSAQHMHDDMRRMTFSQFQIDMDVGVGLDGGVQGSDPQVMLDYSNDGGVKFSKGRWKSAGKIGDTTKRVYWNQLGQCRGRDRVHRITITDPVKVSLIDAKILGKVDGE